jgi:hypothetical protein
METIFVIAYLALSVAVVVSGAIRDNAQRNK